MIAFSFVLATCLALQTTSGATAPSKTPAGQSQALVSIEQENGQKLIAVRRIYVASFGDDIVSKQIESMIISSLGESKRFIITENREKADAVLKGTALEKTSQELHSYGDSTSAGHAAGANGRSGSFGAAAAAISDSSTSTETINNARAAVRLVDREGDVIWATTQESKGAKYKGASADVADRIVKQLLQEIDKLEKKPTATAKP